MARIFVNGRNTVPLIDWNPETHYGWSGSDVRMTAFLPSKRYVFAFPYAPRNLQFSNISSEYVTVERPAYYPLIEWKAQQLTQVSFSFLVADRPSHGFVSVEREIAFLNKFATLNAPIMFSGMGKHLHSLVRDEANLTGRSFRAWRITEFSYNSRNIEKDGSITQAECSISLLEDRNPQLSVISLPPIVYKETPPAKASDPKDDDPPPPGDDYDKMVLGKVGEKGAW